MTFLKKEGVCVGRRGTYLNFRMVWGNTISNKPKWCPESIVDVYFQLGGERLVFWESDNKRAAT
jgi:hypothetical protein